MKGWPLLLALLLSSCGGGGDDPTRKANWPAPPNAMDQTRKAGLTPETHEFVFLHVHAHLDVFLDGDRVTVPAGIGINIKDPAVKSEELPDGAMVYGGIDPPCAQPCVSPLHTHEVGGILHTEARKNDFRTLGEFFTEWNVRLDRNCVGTYCRPDTPVNVYVNGSKYAGDPREIRLTDRTDIAIVIGSAPDTIPSTPRG
jgi:hypothetical protein